MQIEQELCKWSFIAEVLAVSQDKKPLWRWWADPHPVRVTKYAEVANDQTAVERNCYETSVDLINALRLSHSSPGNQLESCVVELFHTCVQSVNY